MSSSDDGSGISQDQANHFAHVQRVDEKIYLAIQIVGGHILLPILILTILFSRKITRHPVFVNFCLSWTFSSVLYSLLVYRGRSDAENLSLTPSPDTCLIQASLLNGVQALTVCTNLTLVMHLWLLLRSCTTNSQSTRCAFFLGVRKEVIYTFMLIGAPFAVFMVWTLVTMVAGSPYALESATNEPIPGSNLSIPGVFYCIILQNADFSHSLTPGLKILRAVLTFTCLVSLITVGFEVHIASLVYRRRKFLKNNTMNWPALFLRIVAFSVYRIVALSLNVAIILHPDEVLLVGIARSNVFNGVIDYFQAAIPLVVFIVFASEKDILSVWCFWKKDKIQEDVEH